MPGLGPLNPGPMQAQQEARKQAWTQQQIQYASDLARQLNQASSETGPIYSPWAGAARMADALVGGMTGMKALQMQRQNLGASMPGAGDFTGGAAPTPSPDMTGGAPSAAPTPSSAAGDLSYGSGIVPMDAAKAAIAGNESNGGNYGERNPATGALGKYQVMPQYLHDHLAAAGMPDMTPEQFLASPEAQEKQFEGEFGALQQKHGSFNKAAIEWFGGPKGLQHVLAGNDISDGFHSGSWYLNNANATLGKLAQAQGGAPVTQGSPQGAQNAPGATPTAAAPQTAVATPQGQQSGLPQFIPPTPGMPTRDFVNRLVMMGHPMGAQLQQEMTNMEQQQTPDGHTYVGNKYVGWHLSGMPAKPNISMVKTYGGAEIPMIPSQDAQGNVTLKPVAQGGAAGGLQGAYDYEQVKADIDRAKNIQSTYQGAADAGAKLSRYAKELDEVANNPNFNVGPSAPLFQWAKKIGSVLDPSNAAQLDTLTPNILMKKVVNLLSNEMTAAQSAEMREAGSNSGRVFQTNVTNALAALPDNPAEMTPAAIHAIAASLRQGGDIATKENLRTQQFFQEHGARGVRDYAPYMNSYRDPNNPNYDKVYDTPAGFSATPAQPLSVGDTRPVAGGTLKRIK